MCGLTGVALHPNASDDARTLAAVAFNDLLVRTQTRGRHATGLAAYVTSEKKVVVAKRAEDATRFVKRKEYERVLNALADGDVSHIIGHTRYATQGAAGLDDNAHPFTFGGVTGAHNGIIHNWRSVERDLRKSKRKEAARGFRVDSEAAFALLNAFDTKPHKALEKLEGYFALTWLRGASLYIARTDAPLTLAYVKSLRALFWNSEKRNLELALKAQDIDIADASKVLVYEPSPGKVYRYTPAMFSAEETNVVHGSTFAYERAHRGMDWSRPTTGTNVTVTNGNGKSKSKHDNGVVTTTALAANGARVKTTTRRPSAFDPLVGSLGGDRVYSFPELTRKLDEAGRRIIALEAEMKKMRRDMAELADDRTPYLDPQLTLLDGDDVETFVRNGGVCSVCGFAGDTRSPLIEHDGEYMHGECAADEYDARIMSGDVARA